MSPTTGFPDQFPSQTECPVSFSRPLSVNKWCAPSICELKYNLLVGHSIQIIEEQLTFPSGTATAQLISVLHKLPPPDTSVRQRKGYRQLDPEEDTTVTNEAPDVPTIENDEETEDTSIRETVQHDGWRSLSWSFVASGSMTVRRHPPRLYLS